MVPAAVSHTPVRSTQLQPIMAPNPNAMTSGVFSTFANLVESVIPASRAIFDHSNPIGSLIRVSLLILAPPTNDAAKVNNKSDFNGRLSKFIFMGLLQSKKVISVAGERVVKAS